MEITKQEAAAAAALRKAVNKLAEVALDCVDISITGQIICGGYTLALEQVSRIQVRVDSLKADPGYL